jgi:hypothetical protein
MKNETPKKILCNKYREPYILVSEYSKSYFSITDPRKQVLDTKTAGPKPHKVQEPSGSTSDTGPTVPPADGENKGSCIAARRPMTQDCSSLQRTTSITTQ